MQPAASHCGIPKREDTKKQREGADYPCLPLFFLVALALPTTRGANTHTLTRPPGVFLLANTAPLLAKRAFMLKR